MKDNLIGIMRVNNKDYISLTDSANQSFTMSPSRWINMTSAKGFISKRERWL